MIRLESNNKQHTKKKYYPSNKKKYYPKQRNNNPPNLSGGFFNGNLATNMKFGGNNHDLSGYVERKIYMRDRHGNVQRASEKQFFNSGKQLGRVLVHDDESKF